MCTGVKDDRLRQSGSFLKETLAGGRIDGAEVLRMADATGSRERISIKQREISV